MAKLTDAQLESLANLHKLDPELVYEVAADHQLLTSLNGKLSQPLGEQPEGPARAYLQANRALFGFENAEAELQAPLERKDRHGWTHLTFHQYYKTLPVWSGRVTVHINPEKRIQSVSNAYHPISFEDLAPKVDAEEAVRVARKFGEHRASDRLKRKPQLMLLPDEKPALVWVFTLTGFQVHSLDTARVPGGWLYFVDAVSGHVIRRTPLVKEAAQTSTGLSIRNPTRLTQVTRTIQTWHDPATGHDELRDTVTGAADHLEIITVDDSATSIDDDPAPHGNNTWNRITGETSTTLDDRLLYQPAEVDAHFFGGQLYQFWRRAPFNRNSIDDAGMNIRMRTHYRCYDAYGNRVACTSASFDGTNINLGDGDMVRYTFKGGQLDVFGHESTHGVMNTEVPPDGLAYLGQSGNAEEAFCDVFGCFAERHWIFENLIAIPPFTCLRNPSDTGDPNADSPGPDHFDNYISSPGGSDPHTNCHILDHAAYLLSFGDTQHHAGRVPVDIPVYPGIGWDQAENIYYRAITNGFTSDPGLGTDTEAYFAKVRTQILAAATWAYGASSCAYKMARLAFYAVGLQPTDQHYGPDVMVMPWGDVTHHGPDWKSPDFAVRDASGNQAEPLRGRHNRLFIKVRNIGDQTANNITVKALYAPYSVTYHHSHFNEIGVSAAFNLTSGQEQELEFDWDMTNLDEDNGGLWPNAGGLAGIRGYDHFCVRAEITCASDVNNCNNTAQNNFTDVALAPEEDFDTAFMIPSPTGEPAVGRLLLKHTLPKTWKVHIDGVSERSVKLDPKKPLVAHLKVTASPVRDYELPFDGVVEGKFGPREIRTRTMRLVDVGAFSGKLTVQRYSARTGAFSGQMQGSLERTGQRFRVAVSGKVLDLEKMAIAGKAEGHLLNEHWQKHEPFVAKFEAVLTPRREVSVALLVKGLKQGGITVAFKRK